MKLQRNFAISRNFLSVAWPRDTDVRQIASTTRRIKPFVSTDCLNQVCIFAIWNVKLVCFHMFDIISEILNNDYCVLLIVTAMFFKWKESNSNFRNKISLTKKKITRTSQLLRNFFVKECIICKIAVIPHILILLYNLCIKYIESLSLSLLFAFE